MAIPTDMVAMPSAIHLFPVAAYTGAATMIPYVDTPAPDMRIQETGTLWYA